MVLERAEKKKSPTIERQKNQYILWLLYVCRGLVAKFETADPELDEVMNGDDGEEEAYHPLGQVSGE